MGYKLPLRVVSTPERFQLVDAADVMVAEMETSPSAEPGSEHDPAEVRKNFEWMAKAANAAAAA